MKYRHKRKKAKGPTYTYTRNPKHRGIGQVQLPIIVRTSSRTLTKS